MTTEKLDSNIYTGAGTFDETKQSFDEAAQAKSFEDVGEWLRKIGREQGLGTRDSIFHDVLYGINRRMQGDTVPGNTDVQGLTFFTRPDLNLTYDNVSQVRTMTHLLTTEENSYQRAIRVLLDPVSSKDFPTNLVDDKLGFIALLSNATISCSGWPDLTLNPYSSPEGMAKETWIMNDKIIEHYEMFTLTLSFQNMRGDPIGLLFLMWLTYISSVYRGVMVPHPHSLINNEIDYMTRIYRLVLDKSGRFVQKWAACGAAFPTAINTGQSFNFSRDTPYNSELDQINVPFTAVGAMYNDPILLREFNLVTLRSNEELEKSPQDFVVINNSDKKLMNYNGYPLINERTNELNWYIHKQTYENYLKGVTA